jgi:penicillin-binding protein 1C
VGTGLHSFHNYSRKNYGLLRLRDALGNPLNVPAIRTIQFAGADRFLDRLRELGFRNLSQSADYYGNGLALGDGEVSLFELVQGYAVLARQGVFRPLRATSSGSGQADQQRRVYTDETATVIADILSDAQSRRLEFGDGHLLRFPIQTAVKTGTSSDHRDALALGFSERYTVGVWMGNLDRKPTNGLTGAAGPALVLRAVFAELNRFGDALPLRLSPQLVSVTICRTSGLRAGNHCPRMQEWFSPGMEPKETCSHRDESGDGRMARRALVPATSAGPRLLQPTQGLQLAKDPRIPAELEAFAFLLPERLDTEKVEWLVDGLVAGVTGRNERRFLWPLSGGDHLAQARIWRSGADEPVTTPIVKFSVK